MVRKEERLRRRWCRLFDTLEKQRDPRQPINYHHAHLWETDDDDDYTGVLLGSAGDFPPRCLWPVRPIKKD